MSQTVLFEDERGFLAMEGNELTIGSKIDDPPKLRLTSPIYPHSGGGGGCISANSSAEGKVAFGSDQTEMAMIRWEQASDVRGTSLPKGEVNFFLNNGGRNDSDMRRACSWIWNKLTFAAFGWGASSVSDTIWSPNGKYFTQIQDDGNLVKYEASAPFSKANATPLWWD